MNISNSSVLVNCEPQPSGSVPAVSSEKAPPSRAAPSPERGQRSDAGTAALVKRFAPQLTPRSPEPVSAGEIALQCLGEVSGVALGVVGATAAHPMLGVLGAFKAGYDVGKCVALERNAALQAESDARGMAQCEAKGGTPVGIAGGVITCLVLQGAQP